MYNKLFTKILDSSIWMEPTHIRIVWLTFIAQMDETGFVQFASIQNVAHRSRVSIEEATDAVACLESPDPNSFDPSNEGRRIERVNGGWMVLNSEKYRSIATREHQKELNRERVRRFRQKKQCNAPVIHGNEIVTTSESESESETKEEKKSSEASEEFVSWFLKKIPHRMVPDSESILSKWRKCYDDMIRLDGRTQKEIAEVSSWALHDSFWQNQFFSPCKLREKNKHGIKYFDVFFTSMTKSRSRNGSQI